MEPLFSGLLQNGTGWIALRADEVYTCFPLTDSEEARARRFRVEADRLAFVAGRNLIRQALSGWMRVDAVPLEIDDLGKPFCPLPNAPHFNLSHAGGWMALAMSLQGPVGIDLEDITRQVDLQKLSARYFSEAEQEALAQGNGMTFFEIWTRKEAWLKAAGTGIRVPLKDTDTLTASGIHFQTFTPAPGIIGCVAVLLSPTSNVHF